MWLEYPCNDHKIPHNFPRQCSRVAIPIHSMLPASAAPHQYSGFGHYLPMSLQTCLHLVYVFPVQKYYRGFLGHGAKSPHTRLVQLCFDIRGHHYHELRQICLPDVLNLQRATHKGVPKWNVPCFLHPVAAMACYPPSAFHQHCHTCVSGAVFWFTENCPPRSQLNHRLPFIVCTDVANLFV